MSIEYIEKYDSNFFSIRQDHYYGIEEMPNYETAHHSLINKGF